MRNTIKNNKKKGRRTMKGGMWQAIKGWWQNINATVENNTNVLVRAQQGTLPKPIKNKIKAPKAKVINRGNNNNSGYGYYVDYVSNNNSNNRNSNRHSPIPHELPEGRKYKTNKRFTTVGGKKITTRRTRRYKR